MAITSFPADQGGAVDVGPEPLDLVVDQASFLDRCRGMASGWWWCVVADEA